MGQAADTKRCMDIASKIQQIGRAADGPAGQEHFAARFA
jgi:hypothetical protein